MKAYIIVDVKITDAARYSEYKKLTPGSLIPYEGRFIVRASPIRVVYADDCR